MNDDPRGTLGSTATGTPASTNPNRRRAPNGSRKCSRCGKPRDRPGDQRYCRACHAAYMREHRPAYAELSDEQRRRARARAYARTYKARGRLVPQPCEACGTTVGVQMHHDDYDRPLDVRWFCRSCHLAHHAVEAAS